MRKAENMRNPTFQLAISFRSNEEVVEGLKAVLYGFQGLYATHYCALLPTISSWRSLALGHLKVPKLSSKVLPGTIQYPLSCPAPHDKLFEIVNARPTQKF